MRWDTDNVMIVTMAVLSAFIGIGLIGSVIRDEPLPEQSIQTAPDTAAMSEYLRLSTRSYEQLLDEHAQQLIRDMDIESRRVRGRVTVYDTVYVTTISADSVIVGPRYEIHVSDDLRLHLRKYPTRPRMTRRERDATWWVNAERNMESDDSVITPPSGGP